MADVVLDENVYIKALASERTQDIEDLRAARVVALVQERHRWIFTHEVLQAYYHQHSLFEERNSVANRLITSLTSVLGSQERSDFLEGVAHVPGSYDLQDAHMVAAAAARAKSLLVTLDARLRHDLIAAGIPEAFGFQVVDVVEAERLFG